MLNKSFFLKLLFLPISMVVLAQDRGFNYYDVDGKAGTPAYKYWSTSVQNNNTPSNAIPVVKSRIQWLSMGKSVTVEHASLEAITSADEVCIGAQLDALTVAKPAYSNASGQKDFSILIYIHAEASKFIALKHSIEIHLNDACKIQSSSDIAKKYSYTGPVWAPTGGNIEAKMKFLNE